LVTTYPPGKGTLNEYAFYFVRALRQKPEVSEIVLLTDELPAGEVYEFDGEGAEITAVSCWDFEALNNPLRILKAVTQAQPDVVLFNIQFATFGGSKAPAAIGLTTPALLKAAGFPTVVLLHNIMETVDLCSAGFARNKMIGTLIRLCGTLTTRLLLTADLVALTIPKYVEILEAKYKTDNVVLTPHGSFESVPLPELDASDGRQQIMTFGKFGTYKKVESLIEATQLLRANGHPDVELLIAGSDSPNTPNYLDNVRAQYGDLPYVAYTGYVPEEDVERIFREATVTVFPYTSTTGSSGVLHQAGSYGKAAVLPHIGDFAELIAEEGYGGEFFEPENPASMAEAIARLLDDPEHRHEIGRQNYAASCGLMIDDVVDWYLLHMQTFFEEPAQKAIPTKALVNQRKPSVVLSAFKRLMYSVLT